MKMHGHHINYVFVALCVEFLNHIIQALTFIGCASRLMALGHGVNANR